MAVRHGQSRCPAMLLPVGAASPWSRTRWHRTRWVGSPSKALPPPTQIMGIYRSDGDDDHRYRSSRVLPHRVGEFSKVEPPLTFSDDDFHAYRESPIGFTASLSSGSTGIFTNDGTRTVAIALTGDTGPDGKIFDTLLPYDINSHGEVAFTPLYGRSAILCG